MREQFSAGDLLSVASLACLGRERRLLITANPLQAWALDGRENAPRFTPPSAPLQCMCLSRDERMLATASGCVIRLLDIDTTNEIRMLVGHTQQINVVSAFNKNPFFWASGGDEGAVFVWDIRAHPADILKLRINRIIRTLAISPDDQFCVVGADDGLHIFDLKKRSHEKHFRNVSIRGLSFHPVEFLLASFGTDRTLRLWDMETFECVCTSDPTDTDIRSAGFTPNGDLLVAGTDASLHLMTCEPITEIVKTELPKNAKLIYAESTEETVEVLCSYANRSFSLRSATFEELLTLEEEKSEETSSPLSDGSDGASRELSGSSSPEIDVEEEKDIVQRANSTVELCKQPSKTLERPARPTAIKIASSPSVRSASTSSLACSPVKPRPRLPPRETMGSRPSVVTPRAAEMSTMKTRIASTGKLNDRSPHDRSKSVTEPPGTTARSKSVARANSVKATAKTKPAESKQAITTFAALYDSTRKRSSANSKNLEDRLLSMQSLCKTVSTKGLASAIDQASQDKRLLSSLLEVISSERLWTLHVAAKVLPLLRNLWKTSKKATAVALEALTEIVTELGPIVKDCANSNATAIGTDVAAEERRDAAQKCLQALIEIRINSSFITEHFTKSQQATFNNVLQTIDSLSSQ